jgi:DNA (cytosine-5)-methyltransferase 1
MLPESRYGGRSVSALVLSLFPGIGLLDRAFEEEGFTVVRGPDLLWGGDVHRFHIPAGRFDGIIGGPPCQAHSQFAALARHRGKKVAQDLIPEFERVVEEGRPAWFLMENVRNARQPMVSGYSVHSFILNNRWLGEEQYRIRRWSFGSPGSVRDLRSAIDFAIFENQEWSNTVLASGGVKPGAEKLRGRKPGRLYGGYKTKHSVQLALRLQGLPDDFFAHSPFTIKGQHLMIGNGVPLAMGRALAKAIACVPKTCFVNGETAIENKGAVSGV